MESYNGYSGRERDKKYQEWKRLYPLGEIPRKVGPCALCGDPERTVEPHSEDYALPYRWEPPFEFMVCKPCHGRIHKRFNQPDTWQYFRDHVRRGGYASEFSAPSVMLERKAAADAELRGEAYTWSPIPGRLRRPGTDWWEALTLSPTALTDGRARPR